MTPEGNESDGTPSAPGVHAGSVPATTAPSTRPTGRAVTALAFRAIASEALFAGADEVHISHRGALYRLKQTALGKLILTK